MPLRSYGDFDSYIQSIAGGENNVLTTEPVGLFEPSSESTAAAKLIPYTGALKAEFQRGIGPWLYSLHTSCPGLMRGKH